MKILVTGASGRIGHYLVDVLLGRGYQVRALVMPGDPLRSRIEKSGVEIAEGLLTDRASLLPAVEGVDVVYHLGALLPRGRTADELFEVNVRGTYNLLEALLPYASRIKRFVFASTDNVYADNLGARYFPIDENHPRLNNDPYGISKIIGEDLCWGYMRRCGMPVAMPRFGVTIECHELVNPEGPRASRYALKPFLARLKAIPNPDSIDAEAIRRLEAEDSNEVKLVIARDPQGRPDVEMCNDPRNVAEALPLFMETDIAVGNIFHIMAAHPFTYSEFVKHLYKLTGWPIVEVTVSSALRWELSIAKARAMLGYNPTRGVFQMLDEGWKIMKPHLAK